MLRKDLLQVLDDSIHWTKLPSPKQYRVHLKWEFGILYDPLYVSGCYTIRLCYTFRNLDVSKRDRDRLPKSHANNSEAYSRRRCMENAKMNNKNIIHQQKGDDSSAPTTSYACRTSDYTSQPLLLGCRTLGNPGIDGWTMRRDIQKLWVSTP